jgi:hypothetical protein
LFKLHLELGEGDQIEPGGSTEKWETVALTREGEGRKEMGDWLHDKSILWKTHRHLLQTNLGTFPCGVTLSHNQYFHQVQEDMNKVHSTCEDWDFVSKDTEISVGRFLIEYFTPLTLGE